MKYELSGLFFLSYNSILLKIAFKMSYQGLQNQRLLRLKPTNAYRIREVSLVWDLQK